MKRYQAIIFFRFLPFSTLTIVQALLPISTAFAQVSPGALYQDLVNNNELKPLSSYSDIQDFANPCLLDQILAYNYNSQINSRIAKPSENITYRKINPTLYLIRISNAATSFPLVFSDSFSTGWRLYLIDNQQSEALASESNRDFKTVNGNVLSVGIDKQPPVQQISNENLISSIFNMSRLLSRMAPGHIEVTCSNTNDDKKLLVDINTGFFDSTFLYPPTHHFRINSFFNGWWIDPDLIQHVDNDSFYELNDTDETTSFTLLLSYSPQHFNYVGLFISCIAFIFSLAYLAFRLCRRLWQLISGNSSG